MLSRHQPLLPNRKHRYPIIQGRIYKVNEKRPQFVNVIAQDNGNCKSPCIDGILDCTPNFYEISVFDGSRINKFLVFLSRHKSIRINQAVRSLSKGSSWTGDILIMRGGVRAQGVVNMRGYDAKLADFALKKFMQCAEQFASPLSIPPGLMFTRRL